MHHRASSAQPLTASWRCVSVFSRLDGSSSRRSGIVGGRWYRERRVCIYRLRAASDMRRLRHIKALLRSFVPGGGADGAQDAQECRGHVVHLTLNHVKSPADPYESLPGLVGLLALRKEDCLDPTNEAVPVTRDVTGSHGYVTRTRFFFLFPISPLFPSRDLGPTVPLHGPALYHMT